VIGAGDAVKTETGAVRLRVRLTPRAGRDKVGAFEVLSSGETVLAVHVRAIPEKGAANVALEGLVAKSLGVAKSKVAVVSGPTSRTKILRIEGDPSELSAAIERLVDHG
jgi:uncharacterized protein YggU (UPF0235/DUF167 family)